MLSESGDKSASLWWSGQSWAVKESERLFDWLTRDWRREHRDLVPLVTVHDGHKLVITSSVAWMVASTSLLQIFLHQNTTQIFFRSRQFLTPKARGGNNLLVVVKLHLQWILRLRTLNNVEVAAWSEQLLLSLYHCSYNTRNRELKGTRDV